MSEKVSKLTEQQRLFVQHYIADPKMNGTQAAIKAGYSEKTAQSISCQLMNKPHVQHAINEAIAGRVDRTGVDTDFVVKELLAAALMAKGDAPIIHSKSEDGRIKKVKVYKTNLTALNKSLEMLGRHVGMFTDKNETHITGSLETTISDISKENAEKRKSLLPKDNK